MDDESNYLENCSKEMSDDFDFVIFWAKEYKKNPEKNRMLLNKFINSQMQICRKALEKLDPNKIIDIFDIRNEKLIKRLLNKEKK